MEWHHIEPRYMGGSPNGKIIQLNAAYHQMITNEFRKQYKYNLGPLNEVVRHNYMRDVYMKYPLPR